MIPVFLVVAALLLSPALQDDNPPRKRVDLVRLTFTVTDKHGRFIKDLKPDQFQILDNNHPPKEVLAFESQTEIPLRIGLLMDVSHSANEPLAFEKQAGEQWLQEAIRPVSDKAFVLAFDEVPEITADFTGDLNKLKAGVRQIRPGAGTAMWDAVSYACRDKMLKEINHTPVRRVIV